MGIALDYTFRIAPSALRAAGVVMVCRYLKPDSVPAYRIGLAEYRELVAAGIDVTLNWELDARDWLGGAMRGASHGRLAVQQAHALGYPAGRVIVGSADFDMSRSEWEGLGRPYAHAFATAIELGGYRPGVYGPWDVLTWVRDERVMDAFWQAGMSTAFSAGRNAKPWPGAHLRQRGHKTVAGQDCDWNDILIPDWGDDMDQNEPVTGLFNRGNRVGDVLADVSNERDWWYTPPGGKTNNPPPAGSRADLVVKAAQQVADLKAAVAALQVPAPSPVSQDDVSGAVAHALSDPAVVAALVKAINDDAARRAAE